MTLKFTLDDAQRAGDEWKFNCGPAAICAVLGKTPEEVRPHLGDFERKGYTNPTLMFAALRSLGATWTPIMKTKTDPRAIIGWPRRGLVRVQWQGPWTEPGVPMRARYRHTHWIGARYVGDRAAQIESLRNGRPPLEIFDINRMCVGGWVPFPEWAGQVVPWLLGEAEPKANGQWHQTHVLELGG